MNDEFDELERDVSRLPMPAVSELLDARVTESLRSIRVQSPTTMLATSLRSTSWGWASLQAVAVASLCLISFAAGRYWYPNSQSQVIELAPQIKQEQYTIVQSTVEPSANLVFQALIGNRQSDETIWGPAVSLNTGNPVMEDL